jgi:hypothetical protein
MGEGWISVRSRGSCMYFILQSISEETILLIRQISEAIINGFLMHC